MISRWITSAIVEREIIDELRTGKFANIAECSGHAQDSEDEGGVESLRRDGYM
jgi:sulfate adenylyltransferase subunit 2